MPGTIASVAIALAVGWGILVLSLAIRRPGAASLGQAARLLPDTLRLIRRVASDREIPRLPRILAWILLAYLASPIDIIPDFLPVVGLADDAILTLLVLRHLMRTAGPQKLTEHWPGTADGLASLRVLVYRGESPGSR